MAAGSTTLAASVSGERWLAIATTWPIRGRAWSQAAAPASVSGSAWTASSVPTSPARAASRKPSATVGRPSARRPAPLTSAASSSWRAAGAAPSASASASGGGRVGGQVGLVPQHHRPARGRQRRAQRVDRLGQPAGRGAQARAERLERVRARAGRPDRRAEPARLAHPQLGHRLGLGRVAAHDGHQVGAVQVRELGAGPGAQGRQAGRLRDPEPGRPRVAQGPPRQLLGQEALLDARARADQHAGAGVAPQQQGGRVDGVLQAHLAGLGGVADHRLGDAVGRPVAVVRPPPPVADPALLHRVVGHGPAGHAPDARPRARRARCCSPPGSGCRPWGCSRAPRGGSRSGTGRLVSAPTGHRSITLPVKRPV